MTAKKCDRILRGFATQDDEMANFYFCKYETVEIVGYGIFGRCTVAESRERNVRTAERKGD